MSVDEMKQGWNLNTWFISVATILLAAALCWFGNASMETRDLLNKKLPSMEEKINNLSLQMGGLVTKSELENKILELRNEQLKIQNEILRSTPKPTEATQNRR